MEIFEVLDLETGRFLNGWMDRYSMYHIYHTIYKPYFCVFLLFNNKTKS